MRLRTFWELRSPSVISPRAIISRTMEFLPDGELIDKVGSYDEYLASDAMARKRQVYTTNEDEEQDD